MTAPISTQVAERPVGASELRMASELSPEQVALLIIAVEQVGDLIGDSHGVTGLHLNGDVAPWDELLGNWLDTFAEASAPLKELREKRLLELEKQKNERWSALAKARGEA